MGNIVEISFHCPIKFYARKMPESYRRYRGWCFTLNNPSDIEFERLLDLECRYYVYGREVGEGGTRHIQGAVYFLDAVTFPVAKVRLGSRVHVEAMRGTPKQASDYCKKDGDFVERGECPDSGGAVEQRARWEDAWEKAKKGTIEEISPEKRLRYYGALTRVRKDFGERPEPLQASCGYWITGPAGTGKTHAVYAAFPNVYVKDLSKWWDGYAGEPVVLLDDVDPESRSWLTRFLKVWGDKWPFQGQNKSGGFFIRPEKFFVTSNYSIEEMGFSVADLYAIKRRFVEIRKETREQEILLF